MLFLLLAAVGLYWHHQMKARERAVAIAAQVCRQVQATFLDGSAYLTSMKLTRREDHSGWSLRRIHGFRYTLGDGRVYEGLIIQLGDVLEQVLLESEQVEQESVPLDELADGATKRPPRGGGGGCCGNKCH
uniref:DUF3301 domain-containing protein n=1 Tax=Magnetococcus massalia (strain MO-1) TaxID=451514 RepID=A0A1S7LKY3_MAGMO|nr:conserved protein of unknown function [Candidatus Magnetococcus massalia]